ncbi:Sensory transduction protein regX3 [compost metagenome]
MKVALLTVGASREPAVDTVLAGVGLRYQRFDSLAEVIHYQCHEPHCVLVVESGRGSEDLTRTVRASRTMLGAVQPILVLGRNSSETDLVAALDAGADDFLSGKLRPRELISRIYALDRRGMNRQGSGRARSCRVEDYELDRGRRSVTLRGRSLTLTAKEFDLVSLLFGNVGFIVSRGELEDALWGHGLHPLSRALDGLISRVRKAMEFGPGNRVILTAVHSRGYRLEVRQQAQAAA